MSILGSYKSTQNDPKDVIASYYSGFKLGKTRRKTLPEQPLRAMYFLLSLLFFDSYFFKIDLTSSVPLEDVLILKKEKKVKVSRGLCLGLLLWLGFFFVVYDEIQFLLGLTILGFQTVSFYHYNDKLVHASKEELMAIETKLSIYFQSRLIVFVELLDLYQLSTIKYHTNHPKV